MARSKLTAAFALRQLHTRLVARPDLSAPPRVCAAAAQAIFGFALDAGPAASDRVILVTVLVLLFAMALVYLVLALDVDVQPPGAGGDGRPHERHSGYHPDGEPRWRPAPQHGRDPAQRRGSAHLRSGGSSSARDDERALHALRKRMVRSTD
jgi:hypothetical protein